MMNKLFFTKKYAIILRYLFIFICFAPTFILRDFTPNNELKYLSIADEALRDGHVFTFWNHGAAYADKPPLYLWIVMAGKWLFGHHSLFFLGLFSIIPALVIAYVMDKWTKPFSSSGLRLTALRMLMTTGLFAASALVVRMDMLMCMFIVLALHTFYRLYEGEDNRRNHLLLPVYIFLAMFTKGPVGFLVPLLSIAVFLLAKRKIKEWGKYMGWKEFGIMAALCALWFGAVFVEGGKDYLDNLLFNQTVNRAVNSFHHQEPFWYYFETIGYLLAPWTLFYLVAILVAWKKKLFHTDLERLFLTVIVSTFVLLSLFSGKLDIYLLPMFPFVVYLSFLLLPRIKPKYLLLALALPGMLLTLAFPALVIARPYWDSPLATSPAILTAACLLSLLSALSFGFFYKKQVLHMANTISTGILAAILISSFAIPSLNSHLGFGNLTQKALQIGQERDIKNYFFYQFRSGENLDSYLNQEIKNIDTKELSKKIKTDKFILFAKSKDMQPGGSLYDFIKNYESYNFGDYSIIIFNLN